MCIYIYVYTCAILCQTVIVLVRAEEIGQQLTVVRSQHVLQVTDSIFSRHDGVARTVRATAAPWGLELSVGGTDIL